MNIKIIQYYSSRSLSSWLCFITVTFQLICGFESYGAEMNFRRNNKDIFSSVVQLEGLIEAKLEVVEALENYILLEELRIKRLKMLIKDNYILKELEKVSNPINALLLIKRLSVDLTNVKNEIIDNKNGIALEEGLRDLDDRKKLPTENDFIGAVEGLFRLQETYLLNSTNLANGIISNKSTGGLSINSQDCYDIGRTGFLLGEFFHTISWMNASLTKKLNENSIKNDEKNNILTKNKFTTIDILEYMSLSSFYLKDYKTSLALSRELYKLDPKNDKFSKNIRDYERLLREQIEEAEIENSYEKELNYEDEAEEEKTNLKIMYESLCRGEKNLQNSQTGSKSKFTYCKYVTRDHPYYVIGPIKEEIVNGDPLVFIYHQVMHDGEIEMIKKLSMPRFERSVVYDPLTGEENPVTYRISKAAWLHSSVHQIVAKINRRIAIFTSLNLETAEDLQVVNYGIGGHYEPHFDFLVYEGFNEEISSFETGNRLSTFLIYMSDVEEGGGTVFMSLNLRILPKKGSAAFWYNLDKNGKGDLNTLHGACPVLVGSKWVANKWIHESGQVCKG